MRPKLQKQSALKLAGRIILGAIAPWDNENPTKEVM
jgi:hypothetical protein